MNISNLVVNIREMEFDYPGYEGLKFTLAHLSREEEAKIREESTVTKYDKESGVPYPEVDNDKFLEIYADKVIKGWKGFTYNILADFFLIDESQVEDMGEEVPFSVENAAALIKHSVKFEGWVMRTTNSIANFRK